VARCAIQVELLPIPEVGNVAESKVDRNAGNYVRRDHAAVFGKPGVLDFFRRMASAAIGSNGLGAEHGLHSGLGMALGALRVTGERGKYSLRIELVAEGAVRTKAGFRINPALGIHVAGVRELEQDRSLLFVAWEGKQRVRARCLRASAMSGDKTQGRRFSLQPGSRQVGFSGDVRDHQPGVAPGARRQGVKTEIQLERNCRSESR
jgi:hypothetical protein